MTPVEYEKEYGSISTVHGMPYVPVADFVGEQAFGEGCAESEKQLHCYGDKESREPLNQARDNDWSDFHEQHVTDSERHLGHR